MGRKSLSIIDNKKLCIRCNENKEISEFSKNILYKCGLDGFCKNCLAIKKYGTPYKGKKGTYQLKSIEYKNGTKLCTNCNLIKSKEEFSKEKEKYKARCRKCLGLKYKLRKFKITEEQYNKFLSIQKGCCAICENPESQEKELSIDHCHKTLKVRGLLCQACNTGIGLLRENKNILLKAIEYLNK